MRFAVESWDPSYGVSADEGTLDQASDPVDLEVERLADDWKPIDPDSSAEQPTAVLFIDGVRRIDARVWVSDEAGDAASPGVCATVAAGVVRCDDTSARVVSAVIERGLYTSAPNAGPMITRHATYSLRPTVGEGDEPLYLGIHNHMTSIETSLSVEADSSDLVVFDGPLRGRDDLGAVGYVKTQHVQYLPAAQHATIGQLAAGQRTPLFLIGGRFTRWSWYLRLPGPISHPLSGVVRLEVAGVGTAAEAIRRASTVSALLPRYASEPHKDTRAPQNLHPIAGLERELRRRLGDPRLLERSLRELSRSQTN